MSVRLPFIAANFTGDPGARSVLVVRLVLDADGLTPACLDIGVAVSVTSGSVELA